MQVTSQAITVAKKWRFVIKFESHKVELPGIEEYESSEDVLEFYDQPYRLTLKFPTKKGQVVTVTHVPDFFVIRQQSAGFEEWKPQAKLEKLTLLQPNRYVKKQDGEWTCPPAEEYAQKLGCYYRIRSDVEIDWIKYRNRQFLKSYIEKNYQIRDEVAAFVKSIVTSQPGITYLKLLQYQKVSPDDINALLATEELYIDLSAAPLAEPEKVHIFRNKETAVYGILSQEWEKAGRIEHLPSYVTFSSRIKQRSGYQQTKKRLGSRAAYQKSNFYWELEFTTPRHGDRPFEICHIDHTQLDIELVCSRTGRSLGRPWATLLIDASSRRILAIYLTFDEPSYRSCMMVLRICVQRFSRFPETIVVDGGAEFGSTYFETLLAAFECTKKQRPAAKARFGSVIERIFGTTNTEFFYNLRGNTQITKNVRMVTKSNNPKGQAVWTLPPP